MSAPMSGLPESSRRADIGRLSEREILVIAAHHSCNGFYGNTNRVHNRVSVRLDIGRSDYLAPSFGEFSNELAKVGGRTNKRCAAQIGKPVLHLWVGKCGINLLVKFVDNFSR